MTSTSPESLGMRLSVASLAVGSGHTRLSAYPCELYFTSDCGLRCCCQVHACFQLQCNALDLPNTNARPRITLEAHARTGTLFTGDIIHSDTVPQHADTESDRRCETERVWLARVSHDTQDVLFVIK